MREIHRLQRRLATGAMLLVVMGSGTSLVACGGDSDKNSGDSIDKKIDDAEQNQNDDAKRGERLDALLDAWIEGCSNDAADKFGGLQGLSDGQYALAKSEIDACVNKRSVDAGFGEVKPK